MKRYEWFNKELNVQEGAEEQSLKMIIAYIQENYDIDLAWWKERHKAQLEWLNEEVD
ncbi:hypothetical protein G8T64_13440 [Clostridium botulinum C]|uniref:hypothetical protein n=1 Tax=Clostridium TaxID=1485 RepID=UPI000A796782|nr:MULTISPECIES: hypothetical protein [Clostridium]MCD3206802.1 hypothetical protein [Clostridium botulinum C]MCD3209543.1 hypothetical protein [Clostridium botulinum C]MCD3226602.1 hypothetical protein [Clostridium botulinum C]MCD3249035.1 hypothetical protein [Clostridium botulinum C]